MASLEDIPVTELKGVGSALAEKLARLGIASLQDLLFHLPHRYKDRTRIIPMGSLRIGDVAVVEGEVMKADLVMGRRRSLQVTLKDNSGFLVMRFFHFNAAQKNQLAEGTLVRCFGEVRPGRAGYEFYHPEYQINPPPMPAVGRATLTPVYPLTEGIQQPRVRGLCQQALGYLQRHPIRDWLPTELLAGYQLPGITEAIQTVHSPPASAPVHLLMEGRHPAQQRLVMEELLAHQLSMLQVREQIQARKALPLLPSGNLAERFLEELPFSLTGAQRHVVSDIRQDLSQPLPMLRLVQGDVGSGKTVVAALAAIQTIGAGAQVAFMAPTEILAEQHYQNFCGWLEPLGIQLAWLSGKVKGKARKEALEAVHSGTASVVIGTHALFQDDVLFHRLALVIVDEQHRFGVHQRLALREKGVGGTLAPHQLIMTATPIPRTLAMSAYADLDTSVIDELPPGRKPVETIVIPDSRREDVIGRVRSACTDGRQAYWVCTLIEESEALQCKAAEVSAQELAERLPGLKVGLVHGRLKSAEKVEVMNRFKQGELDLLVATTVIEVGVDVPSASLIIIENPERLGLAQLHQLRGRVGRGEQASFCVLMYHPPLSANGKARLQALRDSQDGFVIAEKDLEIRGPGEVLGTRQTGMMQFRLADFERDKGWIEPVREMAPGLMQHPQLVQALIRRWLGEKLRYGDV
ncbi:MAG: ATP-dependent DNA helicase RecG [Marinobacter sp.]|uniref:ATP-dependent DNA helicase RecG n=1 Tax=Marinobacter sp. TaxID=50741 RepID=UPI001B64C219|nr:ATP-dependent DNA helicase RecG [Marinobacter sp.]MBQ0745442.1 ATP-dependent DNA helicase RecG [Marinobacter sp.]MBQ0812652.1 ATP-dependent DNA helicase RecG [Marinobacter sp.]|tara:strand:- start:8906 stop:10981 length:2076 start_codon:yes stop_codon:yes gene_type:complete